MRKFSLVAALLALSGIGLYADFSPALQWVQTLSGSGVSTIAGAAADSKGNFYVVGNTTSLDFPSTSAAQRTAGGSTLMRIDSGTGVWQKLYPPGLSQAASLAADPRNPQTLYATAANAIWRSTDAGSTWSVLYQFGSSIVVNSVAVDPSNGNNLYAATTPRVTTSTDPQGALKTTDGGLTWTVIDSGIPASTYGTVDVFHIWVDPKSPQVLFATTDAGLIRSPNAGASWTLVAKSFYQPNDLAFDPNSAGTVYLALGAKLDKSTDDGQTFTPISSLPDQSYFTAIAPDPLHAGILYAGSYSGIFQSVDAGLTWTQKSTATALLVAADPNRAVLYASVPTYGIVKSSDGFTTSSSVGPPEPWPQQILVAGSNLFLVAAPTTDVFAVKFDPSGNIVYSTYFGGTANDTATAMALGADGSIYVTGATSSTDFPVTAGAYLPAMPSSASSSNFVFKLNPDGSLGWATYFADVSSTVNAIAVDSAGATYIAGTSRGIVPTTPGAYQTQFQYMCIPTWMIGCLPGPTSAFVTKLNAKGAGLIYSTYVSSDASKNLVQNAQGLAIDSSGNAFFGGYNNVAKLSADGSALLASAQAGQTGELVISAVALDAASNLYATGTWTNYESGGGFPFTSGAFQTVPQPAIPALPGGPPPGGGQDAIAMKWDSGLSQLLAATLLGGESTDAGESIAIDASGNVIVGGYTDSSAFPTHAPFQTSFSARSGFVASLDSSLSHLLFSTYLGDGRAFDAHAAVPDGNGNILLAGNTLTNAGTLFIGGDPGASFTSNAIAVINKIALQPAPAARLDSVVNYASRMAAPLAPGEAIAAVGSGFGSDAQLLIDGVSLAVVSRTATSLAAVMPDGAKTSGSYQIQVSTGGTLSNSVYVPAAPASPGIFSVDGSGYNQGYILNGDGTLNSPSNPVAPGSAITIFATGPGPYTLSAGYAVAAQTPAVFIDGFYANGIASVMTPVAGLPGNVYQIGVFVPNPATLVAQNPNLLNFKMPAQVAVRLTIGTVNSLNPENSGYISQPGIVLNVK